MEAQTVSTARCIRCGTIHPTGHMTHIGAIGWACDHPAEHNASSGVTCAMQLTYRGYCDLRKDRR